VSDKVPIKRKGQLLLANNVKRLGVRIRKFTVLQT